jgi:hypothetical protein
VQLIDQTPVCKTQREAIFFNSPSVASVRRKLGEEVRFNALIYEMVADLVLSFNVGKNMGNDQIVKTVDTIKTDYYFLKISELKFIFSEASKGRYGKVFDRIDLAIICGWIDEFIIQRDDMLTDQRIAEQKYQETMKPDENSPALSFASIIADLKKKEIEELRDEVVDRNLVDRPVREKTEQELIVQDIFKEFETLYRDQDDIRPPKEPGRFVRYADKILDIESFLRLKLEESAKL